MTQQPSIRAGHLMAHSTRDLFRPPYATLALLNVFLFVVSSAAPQADLLDMTLTLAVSAVSVYVQIAVTLAGAAADPGRSGDAWFRVAARRRCFWRVVGVQLVTVLAVAGGALLLVVGAFVAGGLVALAEAAAVLERAGPIEALRRSAHLGRPARAPLVAVFGALVLVPTVAGQAAYALGWPHPALVAAGAPLVALTTGGTLALARAFVALGGAPAPSLEELQHPDGVTA